MMCLSEFHKASNIRGLCRVHGDGTSAFTTTLLTSCQGQLGVFVTIGPVDHIRRLISAHWGVDKSAPYSQEVTQVDTISVLMWATESNCTSRSIGMNNLFNRVCSHLHVGGVKSTFLMSTEVSQRGSSHS